MNVANFTLGEFCASSKARELNIDNSIPEVLEVDAWATLAMMQGIRNKLCVLKGRDIPIRISSGYRSPSLNRAVGGSSTSDHLLAKACDFTAPEFGTPLEICRALEPLVGILGIGQLIYERPRGVQRAWVHVSTKKPSKDVNRIITEASSGTLAGIVA